MEDDFDRLFGKWQSHPSILADGQHCEIGHCWSNIFNSVAYFLRNPT